MDTLGRLIELALDYLFFVIKWPIETNDLYLDNNIIEDKRMGRYEKK